MTADSEPSPIWIRLCAWCGNPLPGEEKAQDPITPLSILTHGICQMCRDAFFRGLATDRPRTDIDSPPAGEAI
jgi:hypothetical protein